MAVAFVARVADPLIASFRYRVVVPIQALRQLGHQAELFDPARAQAYQTVVFSKAYRSDHQALAAELRARGTRVMLDLCDDMLFNPLNLPAYRKVREDILNMIGLTDRIICSTPVLARQIEAGAGLSRRPEVAPDPYENPRATLRPPTPQQRPASLLWFGRHGSPNAEAGMADLLRIEAALVRAQAHRPFELVVCSDNREKFERLFAQFLIPVRYTPWTPDTFGAVLADCDGVVIPLSDNPFVAAKTHNRLSLALAAGAPVVADSIDSYREFAPFCRLDAWDEGLEEMLLRPETARLRAAAALPYLEKHWSPRAIAPMWAAALGLPAGRVAAVARH